MKYFLLLVQERGAKIPAPVLEVVALAAPPPPYLSVVLLGMFDCESRCFASEVPLSDTSTFLFSYLAHSGSTNFYKASGNTCSPALYCLPPEKPEQKYVP